MSATFDFLSLLPAIVESLSSESSELLTSTSSRIKNAETDILAAFQLRSPAVDSFKDDPNVNELENGSNQFKSI